MKRAISWFALFTIVVLFACYSGKRFTFTASDPDNGKDKKVSSGVSFKKETKVVNYTSPSLAATGWDSERVMSGYDDWEPAIAADPSSSYV